MFGVGFGSFSKFNIGKSDIQRFITMCVEADKEEDEEKILQIADDALSKHIKGIGIAAVSQVLHCIKPEIFPILNSGSSMGMNVYVNLLGIKLDHPTDTTKYVKNTRIIRDFRDANFP